jgi:hypothetical protein
MRLCVYVYRTHGPQIHKIMFMFMFMRLCLLNASNIAKQRLNRCGKAGFRPVSQRFWDEGWSISLRSTKLSHLNYQQLHSSIWAGTALEYWAKKRDRKWFSKSLDHTLTHYSSVQKAQWLASVDNARWRWTRRKDLLRASRDTSRQLLRQWLQQPHVLAPSLAVMLT